MAIIFDERSTADIQGLQRKQEKQRGVSYYIWLLMAVLALLVASGILFYLYFTNKNLPDTPDEIQYQIIRAT